MTYTTYPIPEYVASGSERLDWPKSLAESLYRRFMEAKDSRLTQLLAYCGEERHEGAPLDNVERMGRAVKAMLLSDHEGELVQVRQADVVVDHPTGPLKVADAGEVMLTPVGRALAIDAAVFVAEELSLYSAYRWKLYRGKNRRDINNNFPVVTVDDALKTFNPVKTAIVTASKTLRGEDRDGNGWLFQYKRLTSLLKAD